MLWGLWKEFCIIKSRLSPIEQISYECDKSRHGYGAARPAVFYSAVSTRSHRPKGTVVCFAAVLSVGLADTKNGCNEETSWKSFHYIIKR